MSELPFKLSEISPKVHTKYSRNLHNYLRRESRSGGKQRIDRLKVFEFEDNDTESPQRFIGWFDDDGWFYGTRLMWALCNGGSAHSAAYGPAFKFSPDAEIPDFWESYLEIGVCAADPAHKHYESNHLNRYTYGTARDYRTCNWCGQRHQLKKKQQLITTTHWETLEKSAP